MVLVYNMIALYSLLGVKQVYTTIVIIKNGKHLRVDEQIFVCSLYNSLSQEYLVLNIFLRTDVFVLFSPPSDGHTVEKVKLIVPLSLVISSCM